MTQCSQHCPESTEGRDRLEITPENQIWLCDRWKSQWSRGRSVPATPLPFQATEGCSQLGRDVSVWDLALKSKLVRSHPFSHPSDAAFSPDQRHMATKSTSGRSSSSIRSLDWPLSISRALRMERARTSSTRFAAHTLWTAVGMAAWASGAWIRARTNSCRILAVRGSVASTALRTANIGSSHMWSRQRRTTSRRHPIIFPFGPGRFGAEDIASCRSVLRSRDRRHSPLTAHHWRLSMARHPTRCRYFGPTTAPALQPCPFRAEAPAKLWVGQLMVSLSDRFKTRLSSYTRGQVLKRCTNFSLAYPCDVAFSPRGAVALGSWQVGWVLSAELLATTAPPVWSKNSAGVRTCNSYDDFARSTQCLSWDNEVAKRVARAFLDLAIAAAVSECGIEPSACNYAASWW